jgi:hypothetical protein
MRTTVNIDERLLGQAKLIAAREHRSIGSVLEEALQKFLDDEAKPRTGAGDFVLHTFEPARPGLLPGVDLADKELMAELLEDSDAGAPA